MRFMIIVKASPASEAGVMPSQALLSAMGAYHDELARAGVLLDGAGLRPTRDGWRVHYRADGSRHVQDGPFAEAKEQVAGYTLIQVRSRDEAIEWVRRYPSPGEAGTEAQIEVRPLYEMEDFAPAAPPARG